VETGLPWFCAMGPVMIVYPEGIFYCQVQATDIRNWWRKPWSRGACSSGLPTRSPSRTSSSFCYHDIPLLRQAIAYLLAQFVV